MTAKTDNYRELAQRLRNVSRVTRHGLDHLDATDAADAIDALIKERDALMNECDRWDAVAKNMHEECEGLARENERLRAALSDVQNRLIPLVTAVSGEPKLPVEKPAFASASEQIDELSRLMILHANEAKRFALIGQDIHKIVRAALANAPTPNDKESNKTK